MASYLYVSFCYAPEISVKKHWIAKGCQPLILVKIYLYYQKFRSNPYFYRNWL